MKIGLQIVVPDDEPFSSVSTRAQLATDDGDELDNAIASCIMSPGRLLRLAEKSEDSEFEAAVRMHLAHADRTGYLLVAVQCDRVHVRLESPNKATEGPPDIGEPQVKAPARYEPTRRELSSLRGRGVLCGQCANSGVARDGSRCSCLETTA